MSDPAVDSMPDEQQAYYLLVELATRKRLSRSLFQSACEICALFPGIFNRRDWGDDVISVAANSGNAQMVYAAWLSARQESGLVEILMSICERNGRDEAKAQVGG